MVNSAEPRKPPGRVEPRHAGRPRPWAIVLAGGQGVRLRTLTRHLHGDDRPKQYAALRGTRSLLRETLDRVALLVPADRTVIVTTQQHLPYTAMEVDLAVPGPWVLVQPADRGTAAGVLWPAHWIHARDAAATVAVFPSDHLVLEEEAFMSHVGRIAGFVDARSVWTVLLGALPTDAETGYGWVEPAERIGWAEGSPVHRVRRFVEKPGVETARVLYASGALWNTFVFVTRAAVLVGAGRERLPDVDERLRRAAAFDPAEHRRWALRQAYALMPKANFSRSVLEAWPSELGVSKLPPRITWCDLGTPERVVRALAGLGARPPWVDTWLAGVR